MKHSVSRDIAIHVRDIGIRKRIAYVSCGKDEQLSKLFALLLMIDPSKYVDCGLILSNNDKDRIENEILPHQPNEDSTEMTDPITGCCVKMIDPVICERVKMIDSVICDHDYIQDFGGLDYNSKICQLIYLIDPDMYDNCDLSADELNSLYKTVSTEYGSPEKTSLIRSRVLRYINFNDLIILSKEYPDDISYEKIIKAIRNENDMKYTDVVSVLKQYINDIDTNIKHLDLMCPKEYIDQLKESDDHKIKIEKDKEYVDDLKKIRDQINNLNSLKYTLKKYICEIKSAKNSL